ncbi:MAG: lipoyl synthase [Bacteroidales bacterium]|nr:lipoyl synthase [Bacteroidales bacterium]
MKIRQKPDWLKIQLPGGENYLKIKSLVEAHGLHTICTSGKCPNMGECWTAGTATLMILGEICTRSCKFCATPSGKPLPPDPDEPNKIAATVKTLKLKHVVLTSVDRDDLADGGAGIWALTIKAIRTDCPGTTIETLIPDFGGNSMHLEKVLSEKLEIISHNLETVRRLTPDVRSASNYERSLEVIRQIAAYGIVAKSGIMVGLGEQPDEVLQLMDDLRAVNCSILTIGQYLQPSKHHLPVIEYITPEQFDVYRQAGLERGFTHVESKPLVRSSYHAEKQL